MNAIERALQAGFKAARSVGGREVTASSGETVIAQIEDIPPLAEPAEIAQAKSPLYTRVHVLAGSVQDPRAVTLFTESGQRWHKVLKFEEASQNNWTWIWLCESQRRAAQ